MTFPTGTVVVELSASGARGPMGAQTLNGTGAPASGLGNNGDFYIDTAAHAVYGPKAAGAWGSATPLVGPAGTNGMNGATGTQGNPGYTSTDTWAHLNAITPSGGAGSTGFAIGPDTGTHTDANSVTGVPNTGQFSYQASPAGWIWIGSNTSPGDAAGTVATANAVQFASAFKAALGSASTLRILADFEGPRVAYSGSPTVITELDSLDDTPIALTVHTTISSVPNPRPVYTAGRGLSFSSQAGLQNTTTQIITGTANDFAFFYFADLNVPLLSSTVAHKADLTSLTGVEGDMAKVIGDTLTTFTPDLLNVFDQDLTDAQLVNGYYRNVNGAWTGAAPGVLWYFRDAAKTKYFYGYINRLGQLAVFFYRGSGTTVERLISKGSVVFGGKLNIAVRSFRGIASLWINGAPVCSRDISGLPSITDFADFFANGSDRTTNTTLPITSGLRHDFRGMAWAENVPQSNFIDAYNVLMKRHGAPVAALPSRMTGAILAGQSHAAGYFTVTDNYTITSGCNGSVTVPNANDAELRSPTREGAPGLYAHNNLTNTPTGAADIGTFWLSVANGTSYTIPATHCPSVQGEGPSLGWYKQVRAHRDGRAREWVLSQFSFTGLPLATLFSEPNTYLPDEYLSATIGAFEFVAQLKRQIILERNWAIARGQSYSCDLMLWMHGHADSKITGFNDNAGYAAAFIAYYDLLNAWIKTATGQTNDLKVIMVSPNYSQTGLSVNTIAQDQRMLDIVSTRGTRPLYMGPSEATWSSFIHNYPLGQRGIGEAMGLATTRLMFDGERYLTIQPLAYTYTIGGTTVDIDYSVRAGETLTFRDTNANNIDGRRTDSGVDTYGYGYFKKSSDVTMTIASPGVVTWLAHGLSNGAKVRLYTLGALPTGLTPGTDYYVVNAATDTFQLSATSGGSAINTTGTQSGVHTAYDVSVKISSVAIPTAAVTFTNGSSAITWTGHPLALGVKVRLSTTGALPTGFAPATDYFVAAVVDANTVRLAATPGGTAITAGSAGSGTQTMTAASRVRVTLGAAITSGAEVQYGGFNARVGNLASDTAPTAYYKDQDFTTLVSGSPQFAESASVNDLRQIAGGSRKVLT